MGASHYEPWASSLTVRSVMQANKRRDTMPELAVRRLVHQKGLRYRVDEEPVRGLRRRADLVFRRARVAVFVDGCYWHGCVDHAKTPRTNASYWSAKIARNRERDADTNARLVEAGWLPVRFWEHDDPNQVADLIVALVRSRLNEKGQQATCGHAALDAAGPAV
jgi:DNA mismatch endonuclease, patch repair protein